MNIQELDSYNLGDAVKFNKKLNPRLWGKDEHLLPEVRDHLLKIADDFREFLGVTDLQLKDITISGSNAAYTYTPHSDIDLHLVVDLPEADGSEVYRELFDAKKYQYNDMHHIKIGGYDIEVYVQDANKPHRSQGIYSILNNRWVDVPKRRRPEVDDISIRSKYEDLNHRIEDAIKSNNPDTIGALAKKISDLRQAGLDEHGEFGPENLAFKMLRSQGIIQKLYDARNAAKDHELSLKEKAPPTRVTYGFKTPTVVEDVGMSWDGVSPSTKMFLSETESDEEILKDFIEFCVKELKIEKMPAIKLRKDPQWPVVHKTFGRYINDRHLLEVAWGSRHIMDVLRTVAHELTHRHQHERDGNRMGPEAGETGSPWENEANARAGVLMRDYARLHPDYFAVGQAQGLHADEVTEASVIQNRLPPKLVIGGYTFVLNPTTRNVTVTHGGKPFTTYHYTGLNNYESYADIAYRKIDQTKSSELADIAKRDRASPTAAQRSFEYPTDSRYQVAMPNQDLDQLYRQHDQATAQHGIVGGITDFGKYSSLAKRRRQAAQAQADEVKEANPNQQLSLYRPDGTTYRGEKMPVLDPNDFHSDTNPRKRVDQVTHQDLANRTAPDLVDPIERTERKIDLDRLKNVIRANMKDLLSTETAVLNMRYWKDLTLEQTAQALGLTPERVRQIEAKALRKLRHFSKSDQLKPFVEPRLTWPGIKEAVGYIPTAAEKNDPRFSMALTQDIRPGQLGKEANKLKLKTNSQGQPQIANPNGLFEKLALELAQFKTVSESVEQLDEVRMAPSNLMQWATSPEAKGVRAGFEAELIFRDTQRDDDEDYEMEPDYDQDERCRSISQVIDFFGGGDYGMSSRALNRLQEQLDEAYMEWLDEQMISDFKHEAEDLIRKVLVDEGDWDLDNEIQKQLALIDDLTDDQMNAIIQAGERAPKFTSSKEKVLYAEANPLYEKYLDAQEEAEDLLDELVQDHLKAQDGIYDAALDDFRDNYYIDDDSGFFDDAGLRYMSDIANNYDAEWPYMTGGNSGSGSRDWDSLKDSLENTIDMPVKVSSGYHNATRKEGLWIIEPDSSLTPDDSDDMGLEIVSPPMPLLMALEKLQAVTDWANSDTGNAYTNSSTGLHMGVSVPFKGGDVDYLKLILFLGDEYVLQKFGREANTYCKSAMSKFKENIKGGRADPAGALKLMQHGLLELAHKEIQKGVGDGKYTSAHIQNGYIEFRSPGGDWLAEESADPEVLQNTMLRFARAMSLAANPSEERREYAKKLYKLIAPEGDSEFALFSQFAAGELSAEQLKKRWAEKTIGTEKKMNQRWQLFQFDKIADQWLPVPGQSYNGYSEDEVKNRIWSKFGREALDSGEYELRNMSEDQQWEVYDVNTGETLEIVAGKNKGEVADKVYDKYAEQGIGFNVRPYEDPATMTPRAKLAKRIATKKPEPQKPAQATNERGVPYWEVYELETGHVVHTLLSDDLPDAVTDAYNWLTSIGAEQPDLFKVRPKMNADTPVKDIAPDVAQNFGDDSMAAYERNSDRIDAIRAGQNATDRVGSWSIYDVTLGREISRMTDVPWQEASDRADMLERSTGHNMSVRGLSA